MAFPVLVDPTVPPDSGESARQGASRIRNIFTQLLQLFGFSGTAAVTFTAQPFTITTAGVVTLTQSGATVAADPTAALGIATKQYVDGKVSGASGVYSGTATGTNTYAVTLSPVPASLAALTGLLTSVKFTNGNTAAATLNPNGLGAINIQKGVSTALVSGDILAGAEAPLIYDGTNFQVVPPLIYVPASGGTMTGLLTLSGDPTSALHAATKQYFDNQIGIAGSATLGSTITLVSGVWTDVLSFTVTIPTNTATNFWLQGEMAAGISGISGSPTFQYRFLRNGSVFFTSGSTTITTNLNIAIPGVSKYDTPVAGATTYKLQAQYNGTATVQILTPSELTGFWLGHN